MSDKYKSSKVTELKKKNKEMSNQKAGGIFNNEEYKYKFGVKYSKSAKDFLESFRKEIAKLFKSLDFKNDLNAGIKLDKGQQIIILKYLKIINKMKVDFPSNIKMLKEVEQGIKNEFPAEYQKLL